MSNRRVVFVVGSGRSGTSTMSGTLQTLGLHVPQPEVVADSTNPKGFGEPQWVVDLHHELLARSGVQVSDARPRAWLEAGKVSADHAVRERVSEWLESQFTDGVDELVIKDPRAAWFMGLWRASAERCDATSSYVTMLRPVTEVIGSKKKYYDQRQGDVTRTAAWINMMLHTERATRGEARRFVRYADLLADWTQPVFALGEAFDLQAVKTAMANDIAQVHKFIDPSLRRVTLTWDDVEVPASLRDLAEETWQTLDGLADEGGDTAEAHDRSDQLRVAYDEMYADAEAFAHSTTLAARREGAVATRRELERRRTVRAAPRRRPAAARRPRAWCPRVPGAACARLSAGSAEQCPTSPRSRAWPTTTSPGRGPRAFRSSPGLTCVFRVKNEARNLPWVLPPIFSAVQHVLLVDNGSDDGTLDVAETIAEECGAADRFTGLSYPHAVARAGGEHLRHARDQRPLADALLQLVLQPGPHVLLDEVGRRHGAHARGRGHPARPVVAARVHPDDRGDAAAPADRRRRVDRVARPLAALPRAVGLPDGSGLHLREGLRLGAA